MTVTTHPQGSSVADGRLYVAFELREEKWVVALTSGFGVVPWVQTLAARDWGKLTQVLVKARQRFGLAAAAPVTSCYEASRVGFWLHRTLVGLGLDNRVVDSASISR